MLPAQETGSLVDALELLDEPRYRRRIIRPSLAFDDIAGDAKEFVIFGCGHLAGFALDGIRNARRKAIAFIDNNCSLHGHRFHDLPVLAPSEAVDHFNDSAVFVVAIYNGSSPRHQLAALGCSKVVSYPALFWRFAQHMKGETRLDLPRQFLRDEDQLHRAYDVLSDQESRREFVAQVLWRCTLDYSRLPEHHRAADIYFPRDLFQFRKDEAFMDCGAFDGDSIRLFVGHVGQQYRQILALEPDPVNRRALAEFADSADSSVHDLVVLAYAVSNHNRVVAFDAKASAGSSFSTKTDGITVECRRIDDLAGFGPPSFIKMDIEGAEPDALLGAAQTIRKERPVLAVCAYHKPQHLWQIPLIINSIAPDYEVTLRRYAEECWETVYYAVPRERALRRSSE